MNTIDRVEDKNLPNGKVRSFFISDNYGNYVTIYIEAVSKNERLRHWQTVLPVEQSVILKNFKGYKRD